MSGVIDLRSDTVTRPSPAMLEYMFNAEVGDDVLGDDPTVIKLESRIAGMFGKEDALFCPSGTMTNQIAVKVHTQPGDEVICESTSHVYRFEAGGMAFNSGCSVRLIQGDRGRLKPHQVLENLNPDNVHYPQTRLVVAENTSNMGGGSIYDYADLVELSATCKEKNLRFHLDGARIFNALVETGQKPEDYGRLFDSVSVCFSKGLGAPVGSALIGSREFITKARRIRKVFGGGMRQSGYLAAAAIFALENNITRLKEDHRRAKVLSGHLAGMSYVEEVYPAETNIIIFKLNSKYTQPQLLHLFEDRSLWAVGFGHDKIRLVTHFDFDDQLLARSLEVFSSID